MADLLAAEPSLPVSSSLRNKVKKKEEKKKEEVEITVTKKANLEVCDVEATVWNRAIYKHFRVEFEIYKDHVIVKKCDDLFKQLYKVTESNQFDQRNNSVEEGLVMVFLPLLITYNCTLNMDFMGNDEGTSGSILSDVCPDVCVSKNMPLSWFTCVAHLLRSLSATCEQLIIPARKELAALMSIMDVKAVDLVVSRDEVDSILPSFFNEEKCKKLYINLVGDEVEGVRKIIQGWQKKQYLIPQITLANDYAKWPNAEVATFLRLHDDCLKFEKEDKTSMNFFIGRESDTKILCIHAVAYELCMYEYERKDKKENLVFRAFE